MRAFLGHPQEAGLQLWALVIEGEASRTSSKNPEPTPCRGGGPVLGAESLQASGEPEHSECSDALGEAGMGKGLSSPSPDKSLRAHTQPPDAQGHGQGTAGEGILKSGLR